MLQFHKKLIYYLQKGKGNLNVNMYENILRLQGAQQTLDCKYKRN